MLNGPEDNSVYSIFVYAQKSGGCPHANALCGVMNDLFYFFI
jgi:hypothetical protein